MPYPPPTRCLIWFFTLGLGACAPDSSAPVTGKPFVFAEHVESSPETFDRQDLPAFRDAGAVAGRVTLRDETRLSLVPPSSSRLSFAVDVPDDAVLRFGIAAATLTNPRFRSPIEFELTIKSEDRQETLFSERLERSQRNRWFDRDVDLGPWAGSQVRVFFETRVAPGDDADLFPLWGNPVLAAATERADIPTLILISFDCLRADHVGAYGYPRDTTPSIDAFAEDGVVFETAISTSATTLPTHMSVFTGLTPSEHGASNRHMLSRSVPYLPEILAESGYQVNGVVSGAYLAQNFGFERGFHSYRSLKRPRAAETVDAALEVLDRTQGQPHFLFLHVIDAHWPYDPPSKLRERFGPIRVNVPRMLNKVLKQIPPDGPDEIEQAIDLYDAEVFYADRELGRFFGALEARGLYDGALIILMADHGEAFYEHDNWQHGWTLYDEIVHVPLIVKWPHSATEGRIATQVSQVDIFATLLAEADIHAPHARAINLAEAHSPRFRTHAVSEFTSNPPPGEPATKHVSFRTAELKYVATFRTGPDELTVDELVREELYDLMRDPGESHNLGLDDPPILEDFRRELADYLEESRIYRAFDQGDAVIEDDAIRDRLEALGYITSP